jgi:biopolymer transport protein ExbD
MANRYGIALTAEMKKNFMSSEIVGYPLGAMRQVLNMKPADAKKLSKGIPIDSTNNELSYWVGYAKLSNPELKVAIKGDKESNYKVFADIIGTLQAQNINIFQLVTGPENKPK